MNKKVKITIASVIFGLILGIFITKVVRHFTNTEEFVGIISETSYTRIRYILEWQKTNGENFSEDIPPKAYEIVQNGTKHHHNRSESYSSTCTRPVRKDGKSSTERYSCQKTRSVPVYHPWYVYKINKFVEVNSFVKTDKTIKGVLKAVDPEIVIKEKCEFEPDYTTNDSYFGCQIEGTPKAWYHVTYMAVTPDEIQGLKVSCPMDYQIWSDKKILTRITGFYWTHNHALSCEVK